VPANRCLRQAGTADTLAAQGVVEALRKPRGSCSPCPSPGATSVQGAEVGGLA